MPTIHGAPTLTDLYRQEESHNVDIRQKEANARSTELANQREAAEQPIDLKEKQITLAKSQAMWDEFQQQKPVRDAMNALNIGDANALMSYIQKNGEGYFMGRLTMKLQKEQSDAAYEMYSRGSSVLWNGYNGVKQAAMQGDMAAANKIWAHTVKAYTMATGNNFAEDFPNLAKVDSISADTMPLLEGMAEVWKGSYEDGVAYRLEQLKSWASFNEAQMKAQEDTKQAAITASGKNKKDKPQKSQPAVNVQNEAQLYLDQAYDGAKLGGTDKEKIAIGQMLGNAVENKIADEGDPTTDRTLALQEIVDSMIENGTLRKKGGFFGGDVYEINMEQIEQAAGMSSQSGGAPATVVTWDDL